MPTPINFVPKILLNGITEIPTRFPDIETEFEQPEFHPTLYKPLVLTVEPSKKVKVICSRPPNILAQQK